MLKVSKIKINVFGRSRTHNEQVQMLINKALKRSNPLAISTMQLYEQYDNRLPI